MPYPDPHQPHDTPIRRRPEEPRDRREPGIAPAPDEPYEGARSVPTPTRTIRDGEIQGHEREMPGDRDSQ
jgi:hypothetical protein